jgi:hypothetical protein
MSFSRINFDAISEADLRALIDTGVPEGLLIGVQARRAYGRSDADIKEFLKDASSAAGFSWALPC